MSENITPAPEPTHVWEVPAGRIGAFQAKIDQANAKLVKAGLDARFEVAYESFTKKVNNSPLLPDGTYLWSHAWVIQEWVRASLTGPLKLAHGHFTFVASLVSEEAGVTVHTAPGQELGGYVPAGDDHCDHCNVDRNRTRLYLVRDERDGSIIQLGHSCIELYTGIAPKGLWALTFDAELRAAADELSEGGFGSPRDTSAEVDRVIALAFAHAEQGRKYVSTQAYDATPTVELVRSSLFPSRERMTDDEIRYFRAKSVEAAGYLADTALIAAIKDSVNTVAADSDYGRNLRVILAGERVSYRNQGILASLVKVYAKAQQIAAERKASPAAQGFLGDVKVRLRDIELTLTTVREMDGAYGTTTLFVGRTADGHTVKWFASGSFQFDAGDKLPLKAATVKAHETYNGVDQTVITRGSINYDLVA